MNIQKKYKASGFLIPAVLSASQVFSGAAQAQDPSLTMCLIDPFHPGDAGAMVQSEPYRPDAHGQYPLYPAWLFGYEWPPVILQCVVNAQDPRTGSQSRPRAPVFAVN